LEKRWLIYNGRIHTMSNGLRVDSLAVADSVIAAVGNRLEKDPDFKSYDKIDLAGLAVFPGFTDSHTHLAYYTENLRQVHVQDASSIDSCLEKIAAHADKLKRGQWVSGEGYAPDRFAPPVEPTARMLDKVTGGRPAFIFSKDEHAAWVNSAALKMAGIDRSTPDPRGGKIGRDAEGNLTGILYELPAIQMVHNLVPRPSPREFDRLYPESLLMAYRKGVTGVHSFDGQSGWANWRRLAERGKLGLRVDYYPPVERVEQLQQDRVYFGTRIGLLRFVGVKIFSDGSLGSRSALCFNKYAGSNDNRGIETTTVSRMKRLVRKAARLNLPAAIHAIGDKAVANVLDVFEDAPGLEFGARHRIEHLQLIRRKDIARLKRLGVTASMQPSHCPSDAALMERYWGARARNAFVFRTLLDSGVPLAFGSDLPIEPLDPLAGIAAAVQRRYSSSRKLFRPEQRISAYEAIFGFTAGAARAVGSELSRGRLLPGFDADLVVLDQDPIRLPPTRIAATQVLATVLAGRPVFSDGLDQLAP
jgi:predicted amidohydrolase YtcJ